jgi:hypothetical protein
VISSGITAGNSYSFRYKVKNLFGFSQDYSPLLNVIAATVPDAPSSVTVSLDNLNIDITWTTPNSNGSPLLSFSIEI